MKTVVTYIVAVIVAEKMITLYLGASEGVTLTGAFATLGAYYVAALLALFVRAAFSEGAKHIFLIVFGILALFGVNVYTHYSQGIDTLEAVTHAHGELLMLLAFILAYMTAFFFNEKIFRPVVEGIRKRQKGEDNPEENRKENSESQEDKDQV